ncbi:hypothetical protein EN751_40105, partial [Mesorhizobium sp. M4A.F.Ca.ET.029.04.2.1]
MQTDADGDGVLDSDITDVTVLNADGSKTETVSTYNGAGTILIDKTVTTTSADGLTTSVAHYLLAVAPQLKNDFYTLLR